MSRSYFTEDQKTVRVPSPKWTSEEEQTIREILYDKGYFVNTFQRVGADGKTHDSLQVEREDIPQLVEECFRQRLHFELQAEGSYKASIIFVYDYPAITILMAVRRFRKNKLNGGVL